MGEFVEDLIKNKTIHLDFLQNWVGRFLVKYFEWSLIPFFLFGIFVFGYFITRSQAETNGTIARFYYSDLEQYSIGRNSGIRTHNYKALILVLNDSSRYAVLNRSKQSALKDRIHEGTKIKLKYHLEFEAMHRKLVDFEQTNKIIKDFDETDGTYASVNSLMFNDGKVVKFQDVNSYVILIFLVFGIWYLLIALNYLKKLWDEPSETKKNDYSLKKETKTVNMEQVYYEKCPACGMRLNKRDNECPDCGLNLK